MVLDVSKLTGTADTMTMPSDGMMLAAIKASRGDSVYEEDPDTAALEARIAKMTGKEDCLFAVSGTLTNRECNRLSFAQQWPDADGAQSWLSGRI